MTDILLATYNGEKYIGSQIKSIQSQTDKDWRLIIHDDGSTDKTVDLIKQFQTQDKRITLIEDGIKLGNAGENFMHLLKFTDAPHIMFCDQDDVWFPEKIETMKKYISSDIKPEIAYSDARAWDGENTLYLQNNKAYGFESVLFQNCGIQGASSIFNRPALKLMRRWEGVLSMHDHLLLLIGVTFGTTTHINKPLMYYRRHNNAVTAEARHSYSIRTLTDGHKEYVLDPVHFHTIEKFLRTYQDLIPENKKKKLNQFVSLPKKNAISRLTTILRYGFRLRDSRAILIAKLILRKFYPDINSGKS